MYDSDIVFLDVIEKKNGFVDYSLCKNNFISDSSKNMNINNIGILNNRNNIKRFIMF